MNGKKFFGLILAVIVLIIVLIIKDPFDLLYRGRKNKLTEAAKVYVEKFDSNDVIVKYAEGEDILEPKCYKLDDGFNKSLGVDYPKYYGSITYIGDEPYIWLSDGKFLAYGNKSGISIIKSRAKNENCDTTVLQ